MGEAVRGLDGFRGIEVVRLADAGYHGIEDIAVLLSGELLHDDRHLLFLDAVVRVSHIFLRSLVEDRGIHEFHRVCELPQANFQVGMAVGDHVCRIEPRERQVLRILEHARGTDGERHVDALDDLPEVKLYVFRQSRGDEGASDLVVVLGLDGETLQIVLREKLLVGVGADHEGHGGMDVDPLVALRYVRAAQEGVDEGDPARLPAERSAADADEGGVGALGVGAELGDIAGAVAVEQVPHRGRKVLTHRLAVGEVGDFLGPKLIGEIELRACAEPDRNVVAPRVVLHGFDRDLFDQSLELLDVVCARYLGPVRSAEDEIAEAEIRHDEIPQLL